MRLGSLFSGYGGLDLGVEAVTGASTAWCSDIDPGACKILAHRWPTVPNLGDISSVDWADVEPVDIITGGFPCQDVSLAGRRAGMTEGTRSGLWSEMLRAVETLRPSLMVAENVRGLLSAAADSQVEQCPWCMGDGTGVPLRALGAVLGDLADIGYDAAWHGLTAASVGAPHGRFRVFIVAWPTADTDSIGHERGRLAWGRRDGLANHRDDATHPDRAGSQGPQPTPGRNMPDRGATAKLCGFCGDPDDFHDEGGFCAGRCGGSCAAADTSSDGWDEGRTESTRLVGGPDAAIGGSAVAPDAEGFPRRIRYGDDVFTRCGEVRHFPAAGRGPITDAYGDGRESVGRFDSIERDSHRRDSQNSDGHQGQPPVTAYADRDTVRVEPIRELRGSDPTKPADLIQWGQFEPAVRRWEQLTRPAPAPTEIGAKGGQRLSPRFVEWMMGLPAGHVTDPAVGLSRNEQLKACGNGVVPQQAEAALRYLLDVRELVA